jgi:hypothetical protein
LGMAMGETRRSPLHRSPMDGAGWPPKARENPKNGSPSVAIVSASAPDKAGDATNRARSQGIRFITFHTPDRDLPDRDGMNLVHQAFWHLTAVPVVHGISDRA